MPDLDDIFQTGEPVPKAALKQYLADLTPEPDGETGVINPGYPIGDVRRYGVFPDGTTNWENDHPDKITAIFSNSCLPGVEIFWPTGEYHTSLNLTSGYTNSKMRFEPGAVFHGILHILSASGSRWLGDVGSYDRLGCTTGTRDAQFGIVRMLHDPAKNISGYGNRGIHFLGCSDISWDTIIIDNTGAAGSPAPAENSIWSAFTIQGIDPSAVGGALGYRFTGNKVWIKNSQSHGSYINALDINIGEIIIDGFANQAIEFDGDLLADSDSEAQSEVGAGLWLNRWTGHIGRVVIRQGNSSPANDVYTLLIDQTGRNPGPGANAMGTIGELDVEVGGTNNRGVNFGAIISPSTNINVKIESLIASLKSGTSMATGYGMCNINPSSTTTDTRYRVSIGKFTVVSGGAATQWKVTGGTGTRVNIDLGIEGWTVIEMAAGRLLVVDSSAQADVVSGSVGRIEGTYTGGSSASPLVEVNSAKNFKVGNMRIVPVSVVSTPGALFTSCTDCSLDMARTGLNGNYGVTLDTTTRFRLSGSIEGNAGAGTGVIFTGTHVDISLRDLHLTTLAKGFDNGAGMAFTRGAAVNVSAVSNTDDTDLTTADFPAANQSACTNFAV